MRTIFENLFKKIRFVIDHIKDMKVQVIFEYFKNK